VTFTLYDSALGRQVDLVPLVPGEVSIYCCGMTVQSAPHLGHIRKEVVFDVLRRWLTWSGYKVNFVVNITDINEKIVAKAAAEGRTWFAHAYIFEREFRKAATLLGCLAPTYEPRASGTITEQIELVEAILANGHAYVADDGSGDVWFDVRSWPHYGELSHQDVADIGQDASEDVADIGVGAAAADGLRAKRDPRDFALWKGYKEGEPVTMTWPSPWGRGRPGWHLECSAMSGKYLGAAFDIHGGGIDLKFPHHENELAQSRAAGRPFAHHWMHNNFLTDPQGEKMSKSLGNVLGVVEVVARHSARAVRAYILAPHYRSLMEFTDEAVEEAAAGLARIDSFVERAAERVGAVTPARTFDPMTGELQDAATPDGRDGSLPDKFAAALDDDLGTPAAMAALHEAVREGNKALDAGDAAAVQVTLAQVQNMLAVLGLWKDDPLWQGGAAADEWRPVADALIAALLEQRQAAKAAKDWPTADRLRDQLTAAGVTIEDTPTGPRWTRGSGAGA
jgi:cysteinyl-tRNA synthetase